MFVFPVSYTETKSFILIFQDDLFNTVQVKELLFEGYAPGSLTLLMDIYMNISHQPHEDETCHYLLSYPIQLLLYK